MILAGATDPAVAARIGNGIHRMAIQRHRAAHVIAPARQLLAVSGRGVDLREERAEIAAAAEAGDPSAWLGLHSIVADLKRVHDRLEKSADEAAQDRQLGAVAGLSTAQLRATEVRSRLGSQWGIRPVARPRDGVAAVQPGDQFYRWPASHRGGAHDRPSYRRGSDARLLDGHPGLTGRRAYGRGARRRSG